MILDLKQIGERIARRRRELGYKQYEVCDMLNVNSKYLSNIETGRFAPSLDVIMLLCEHLQVTPDYIFLGKSIPSSSDNIQEISEKLRNLSEDDRKIVLGMIDLLDKYHRT